MSWVTLDDGQHVYIGSGGEFQPRGPTAPKASGAKPADRVHQPGPGGMARTASGLNLHERMTASATAASTRAAAARARGDRAGELAAHEHRAIILAKQNDIKGVHKSQFGYARTAPGSEKTAAAALVARVRGGGPVTAATGLPHPSTLKGMSAPAGDAAGLARERGRISAGVSAVRASAIAAQSRERFARGEHDAAGVYREGAKVKVTGTRTITNPVTGKGKVTIPTGVVKIGDRTSKIGDQQAMHLAGKLPRASTDPGERSSRASQLIAQRSAAKPAASPSGVSPHALAGKMPIGKFAAGVNPSEIAKGYGLPHDFYTDARVTKRGAGGFPSLRGEVHVSDKYDPKGEVSKAVDARESAQKRGLYEGTRRKFYDQNVEKAIGSAAKRASDSAVPGATQRESLKRGFSR